jgi:DNA (cytosine-5)-methyltransferase 1
MITYGSLFSGVGGFDLGCDAAGWDCAWQVEYDARCRAVLRRRWANPDHYDDVRTVNGWDVEPVDVITYGFPCQDLSVAGKRAGLDGERSGLFFEAIRIIDEMRKATDGAYPRVVVAENVTGLLSADRGDAMGDGAGTVRPRGLRSYARSVR